LKHLATARLAILSLLMSQTVKADDKAPAACAPGAVLSEITFTVKVTDPKTIKGGSATSPYIQLADPTKDLANLEDAAAIVLPCREIIVVADYPLADEFEFKLVSDAPTGFTRAEIARKISTLYQEIYAKEERTTKTPVVPLEKRKGLINRNATDGEYGIWGHDLRDLVLGRIRPEAHGDMVHVRLQIDS
jgi:hypothetical protein